MKIRFVTFTGIDSWTDIDRLEQIQEKYPYAEFGVLASYHFSDNGPRFPEPDIIKQLAGRKLNLSLHLCGSLAVQSALQNFEPARQLFKDYDMSIFQRIQLNMRLNSVPKERLMQLTMPWDVKQVIIQMHTPALCQQFFDDGWHHDNLSYLLDSSAGAGIDYPIQIVTKKGETVGYAGGIGTDNVEKKLKVLLAHEGDDTFWIDMETKVRSMDAGIEKFDLNKVERVLEICDPLIKGQQTVRHIMPWWATV